MHIQEYEALMLEYLAHLRRGKRPIWSANKLGEWYTMALRRERVEDPKHNKVVTS